MDFPPAISTMKLHFMENLSCRVANPFFVAARKPRDARENLANSPNSLPSRFITTSTNHYILLFVSMKLHSADFNKNQPVPCTNHYI